MFIVFIRSKIEYLCVMWSPIKQAEMNNLVGIQKHSGIKVERMEHTDYHERLREQGLYSLERVVGLQISQYGWLNLPVSLFRTCEDLY